MTIHSRPLFGTENTVMGRRGLFLSGMFLLSLGTPAHVAAQSYGSPATPPQLRKVCVVERAAYIFQYGAGPRPGAPPLRVLSGIAGTSVPAWTTKRYDPFGGMSVGNAKFPFRWSFMNGWLFATNTPYCRTDNCWTSLLRYPTETLIPGDGGQSTMDHDHPKARRDPLTGKRPPNFGAIRPVRKTFGRFKWLDRGQGPQWTMVFEKWDPVVHYDIRATDDSTVELFMTIDGVLTAWRFDGTDWTHLREYAQRVDGPFLVCRDGKFIVTEVGGKWSLIGRERSTKHILRRGAAAG